MTLLTSAKRVARETDQGTITTIAGTVADWIQRIVDYLNEGYKIVYQEAYRNQDSDIKGYWNISTSGYDISSTNLLKLDTLYIDQYRPIRILSTYNEFIQIANDESITGQPTDACAFDDKLYLYPVPDQSYKINYTGKMGFAALSADAGVFLVDENTVINYAIYKVNKYDGFPDKAQSAYQDFLTCKTNFLDSCNISNGLPPIVLPEDAYYYGSTIHQIV